MMATAKRTITAVVLYLFLLLVKVTFAPNPRKWALACAQILNFFTVISWTLGLGCRTPISGFGWKALRCSVRHSPTTKASRPSKVSNCFLFHRHQRVLEEGRVRWWWLVRAIVGLWWKMWMTRNIVTVITATITVAIIVKRMKMMMTMMMMMKMLLKKMAKMMMMLSAVRITSYICSGQDFSESHT